MLNWLAYGWPFSFETLSKHRKPKTSEVYNTYWKFAAKRQKIFFKRLKGESAPWTDDDILKEHRFTNVYRASDRVSQYLINYVLYSKVYSKKDVFFRLMLFKTFNKVATWELLEKHFGEITYGTYTYKKFSKVLGDAMSKGQSIYNGAYIMASGRSYFGHPKKHQNHLKLIEKMMDDELWKEVSKAASLSQVYDLMIDYPTIGKFLAFQYTIDINYSALTNFSEMDFVVAGPGAIEGIAKCFIDTGGRSPEEIIEWVCKRQEQEFAKRGLDFDSLWGRRLQLIDCQNLFCEVGKYARVKHPEIDGGTGRKRIKQKFKPLEEPVLYSYPPKWEINSKIEAYYEQREKCFCESL